MAEQFANVLAEVAPPGDYEHRDRDVKALTAEYNAIDPTDTLAQARFFISNLPSAPLLGAINAPPDLLQKIRDLNSAKLRNNPHVAGQNLGVRYQSVRNFETLAEALVATSPVLTYRDLEEAEANASTKAATAHVYFQVKRTSGGKCTELHVTLQVGDQFLEAVWNSKVVPSADQEVLRSIFTKKHGNHPTIAEPLTDIEKLCAAHSELGVQDLILGGEFAKGELFCDVVPKYRHFKRKGEEMWPTNGVIELKRSGAELRAFYVIIYLLIIAHENKSVTSTGIHNNLHSCLNLILEALGLKNLTRLPFHEALSALAEQATKLYWTDEKTETPHTFLEDASAFEKVNHTQFMDKIYELLSHDTMRASFENQPPFLTTYCKEGAHSNPEMEGLYHQSLEVLYRLLLKQA